MEIIEYRDEFREQIKDLLVELQQYLVEIDDWNTQVLLKEYKDKYFELDMQLVKDNCGKIYLAKENNQIVGMIIGVINKKDNIDKLTNDCAKTGSVLELIIKKESRGKGIGKVLLNKMEEYFKLCDCKRISIEVFGPNKGALEFYKNSGYSEREFILGKRL